MATLKSPGDMRNSRDKPIGCHPVLEFITIISESEKSLPLKNVSGQIIGFEYIAPDLTTDTTFNVEFYSKNGILIDEKTGLADNQTSGLFVNTYTDNLFIPQDCTAKVVFTTAQVATFEVILHMK